jgi:hypothetical protein
MSGRSNTTISAKNKSKEKQTTTRSGRAGLTFPVGRVVSFCLFIVVEDTNEFLFSIVISNKVIMENELVKVHQYIWVKLIFIFAIIFIIFLFYSCCS